MVLAANPLSAGNFIHFMPHDGHEVVDPLTGKTLTVEGYKIVLHISGMGAESFKTIRARLMTPRKLLIRVPFIHEWMVDEKTRVFQAERDMVPQHDEIAFERAEKMYLNVKNKYKHMYYCYEFEQDMTVKYTRAIFNDYHENDLQPNLVIYDNSEGAEKARIVFLLEKEIVDESTKLVDVADDKKISPAEYFARVKAAKGKDDDE